MLALIDYQEEKIEDIKEDTQRLHSFMEGVCLEIGNFIKLKTFTADPKMKYNNLPLSTIATLTNIPKFTYMEIIDKIKYIDVLWFSDKGFQFPRRAIEIVDNIGTLEPALKRTLQLMEFNLSSYILCRKEHIAKIDKELSIEPYLRIKKRYIIRDYDSILEIYNNPFAHQADEFFHIENHF